MPKDRLPSDSQHAALLAEQAELDREHAGLKDRQDDRPAHAEHHRKLREHINKLHEHIRLLRAER